MPVCSVYTPPTCTPCLLYIHLNAYRHSLYRRVSLAQTTQETIPFTTVAFSVYGFLLMCSLAFLRSALSLGRLLGENRLCLLRHTSKRALLRKGKVLREPADCIPIMHCCLLDRTTLANIQRCDCGHHAGLDKALVRFDTGLEMT